MDMQQLHRIVDAIVSRESGLYDMVYFYGDADRILTILADIENAYATHYPTEKVVRIDAEVFCNEIIQNLYSGVFSAPQCKCDLYIFENIEKIAGTGIVEQRIYGIFDWLLEHHRRIIVTGAVPSATIDKLAPRICAQLDGGISFRIDPE